MGIQNVTAFVIILLFVCLVLAIVYILCNSAKSPIDVCCSATPLGITLPTIKGALPNLEMPKLGMPNLGIPNMLTDLVKNPLSWLVAGSIATIGLSYFISAAKSSTNINVLNYPNYSNNGTNENFEENNESDCDNNHGHVCLKNENNSQTKTAIVI